MLTIHERFWRSQKCNQTISVFITQVISDSTPRCRPLCRYRWAELSPHHLPGREGLLRRDPPLIFHPQGSLPGLSSTDQKPSGSNWCLWFLAGLPLPSPPNQTPTQGHTGLFLLMTYIGADYRYPHLHRLCPGESPTVFSLEMSTISYFKDPRLSSLLEISEPPWISEAGTTPATRRRHRCHGHHTRSVIASSSRRHPSLGNGVIRHKTASSYGAPLMNRMSGFVV